MLNVAYFQRCQLLTVAIVLGLPHTSELEITFIEINNEVNNEVKKI